MSFFGERSSAAEMQSEVVRAAQHDARLRTFALGLHPPDDEPGVPVALDSIQLLRTDDFIVVMSGFVAYSTGFTLRLSVMARQLETNERLAPLSMPYRAGGVDFGVQYADGRRGDANDRVDPFPPPQQAKRVLIAQHGGQGGSRRFDHNLWLHPLPPEGPVTFVARWQDKGIGEQRHEIDAQPIVDAAAKSVPFWPRDVSTATASSPLEVEGALLGQLANRLARIDGVRIRGVMLDGHHPDTRVVIAYDLEASPDHTLSEPIWGAGREVSLTNDSPVDVADHYSRRLRGEVS